MVVLLDVDDDVPYYNDDTYRFLDLRDPMVQEATGIKIVDNKIVLDMECPYTTENPQVSKKGPGRDRSKYWGYRNKKMIAALYSKSRRKFAAATAGEDDDSEGSCPKGEDSITTDSSGGSTATSDTTDSEHQEAEPTDDAPLPPGERVSEVSSVSPVPEPPAASSGGPEVDKTDSLA